MPTDRTPYDAVTFTNDQVTLAGSLALPGSGGASQAPGIVLVGGSGPSDRDNGTYFPPIRRHLRDAGFAVLSYDKRGVGDSSGDWREATLADLADDARAALRFLRAQPGVRPGAVGVFGHSEGGWVALRAAAAEGDALPWVITNSCPGTTPAIQERHALARVVRRDTDDVAGVLSLYDRIVAAGRRDAGFAEVSALVAAAGDPPALAAFWDGMDERLWGFLKRKQDHDPLADAAHLRCPHLALFGAADELVPVADSMHAYATTACRPGRHPTATLTTELFPGADHRLQTPGTDRLAPGYLAVLTNWLAGRTF
ncbi:alpha/beta hydrolase family protein [Streptomyces sp. NBC_01465]|uniref:alpha/beta hydrolase family protein n=1 Tax=Streptomyces sp. NBC_01465 TaxID=2903878 RepID=UPI002E369EB6|nr:alpha/beta hydrolase [Streptomyces sp. NBC_01465]